MKHARHRPHVMPQLQAGASHLGLRLAQVDKTFAALANGSGRISKAQAAQLFSMEGAAEGSAETAQLIWSEMRLPDHAMLSQVGSTGESCPHNAMLVQISRWICSASLAACKTVRSRRHAQRGMHLHHYFAGTLLLQLSPRDMLLQRAWAALIVQHPTGKGKRRQ